MSNTQPPDDDDAGPSRVLIGGAGLLALLGASCCVLPIGLSMIGLGGAWLTLLGPFIAYRGPILIGIAIAILWAWYRVFRPKACISRRRSAIIWTACATVAFIVSLTSPYWEGSAQRFMWDLWGSTR